MASETITLSDMPRIKSLEFSHRCAESHPIQLPSRQFANAIMGSGQTFHNASEFCGAIYLMLVARRFRYKFKRNSMKHMTYDAPKLGGPLTTRQPAEYKWRSGYPTPL